MKAVVCVWVGGGGDHCSRLVKEERRMFDSRVQSVYSFSAELGLLYL